ncbi:hypothetical protein KKA00_04960 [bacterium]|nr:hypothetical protein [bacterium]MBU1651546.1 hypothetical protein [bacterium]
MPSNNNNIIAWLKLGFGSLVIGSFVWLMTTGWTPPGILGETIRHNQENDIDASPFFYGDVENMTELEEGLQVVVK